MTRVIRMPAIRKESSAAGPAAAMIVPLPTNRPAPMVPPMAIIVICRCLRPLLSPAVSVSSTTSVTVDLLSSVGMRGYTLVPQDHPEQVQGCTYFMVQCRSDCRVSSNRVRTLILRATAQVVVRRAAEHDADSCVARDLVVGCGTRNRPRISRHPPVPRTLPGSRSGGSAVGQGSAPGAIWCRPLRGAGEQLGESDRRALDEPGVGALHRFCCLVP